MHRLKIAIFASGSGSNAERIIRFFADRDSAAVVLVLSNNPNAFVLERAERLGVPTLVFDRKRFQEGDYIASLLQLHKIDLVVLAGFLWLIPGHLTERFRFVNIHPALLPAYGGKNMYGMNVHRAVIADKSGESGITIHEVNDRYDEGKIIFQAKCKVTPDDTPESLAEKIHELEHRYYPEVIEKLVLEMKGKALT